MIADIHWTPTSFEQPSLLDNVAASTRRRGTVLICHHLLFLFNSVSLIASWNFICNRWKKFYNWVWLTEMSQKSPTATPISIAFSKWYFLTSYYASHYWSCNIIFPASRTAVVSIVSEWALSSKWGWVGSLVKAAPEHWYAAVQVQPPGSRSCSFPLASLSPHYTLQQSLVWAESQSGSVSLPRPPLAGSAWAGLTWWWTEWMINNAAAAALHRQLT